MAHIAKVSPGYRSVRQLGLLLAARFLGFGFRVESGERWGAWGRGGERNEERQKNACLKSC